MTPVVVDASLAVGWAAERGSEAVIEGMIARIYQATGKVPAIWRLEVANALLNKVQGKENGHEALLAWLAQIGELPVGADDMTHARAWSRILPIAARHDLSLYDASYVELAVRLDAPLLTLDGKMARAAAQEGVVVEYAEPKSTNPS